MASEAVMNFGQVFIQRMTGSVWGRKVLNGSPPPMDLTSIQVASIGAELLQRTRKLQGTFVVVEEKNGAIVSWVDYESMKRSEAWREYTVFCTRLWHVDLLSMDVPHRIAFLINTYNALLFHAQIDMKPSSVMDRLSMFSRCSYGLGNQVYSLDEIENGLLRANRPAPMTMFKPFGASDPRAKVALAASQVDPRVHFALNCGAQSCPSVRFYDSDQIEIQLANAAEQFCEQSIKVSRDDTKTDNGVVPWVVSMSSIFKWYRRDFVRKGADSDVDLLRNLSKYLPDGPLKVQLTACLESDFQIVFDEYNWNSNKKDMSKL